MAIDSREKRQSAYGVFHVKGIPAVTPNAANDQEWRQAVFWGYSGILAGVPAVAIDAYHSVVSFIGSYGAGSLSAVTSSGLGILSALDPSEGLTSIMQSRGKGVNSSIDETGQSTESGI